MDRTHTAKRAKLPRDPLRGARIAITGGTSGLGLALVRTLVARGARVAFVARDASRVRQVAAETDAHGIVGDVARKEDIHAIALQIAGVLGGLDVLVNNASTLGPVPLRPLTDVECEDFEHTLATNLVGPFRLTRALAGSLSKSAREGGRALVLNIASDAAFNPYPGWGVYGASKAALHHLTRIWQEELGPQGFRFLSIDPGDMDTPMHALALPDADRATLKRPADVASELADVLARELDTHARSEVPLLDAALAR